MPTWLIAALAMLSGPALKSAQGFLRTRTGTAVAAGTAGAGSAMVLDNEGGSFFGGLPFIGGGDRPARRRRRRALTASDKADIAFVAGILGKPAGKDIAMIIASRPR